MPVRCLAGLVLWLGVWQVAAGQDGPVRPPVPFVKPPVPQSVEIGGRVGPLPQPHPLCSGTLNVAQRLPREQPLDAAGHLRQAADHLEAAGLSEEASRFHEQAQQAESRQRLQRKLAELETLQAEVDELRRLAHVSSQVQLSVRMLEADPRTLTAAALTATPANPAGDIRLTSLLLPAPASEPHGTVAEDTARLIQRLDELQARGLVKVIAAPALRTTLGQPAQLRTGGEFPIPVPSGGGKMDVDWRPFGVHLDAVPTLLGNGKLRLEIEAEVSRRTEDTIPVGGGARMPVLSTSRVHSEVELRPGETMVLGGMVSRSRSELPDGTTEETARELVILVTAEFVEAVCPAPADGAAGVPPECPQADGMTNAWGLPASVLSASTTQVRFLNPPGTHIAWQNPAGGSKERIVAPGRHDFARGATYRLTLTNIPERPNLVLHSTLTLDPACPATEAYLAHNAVPVGWTDEDLDRIQAGQFVTKVVYLRDLPPGELALPGIETLVSTRLDPGVDPLAEADCRGTVIAVLRTGIRSGDEWP